MGRRAAGAAELAELTVEHPHALPDGTVLTPVNDWSEVPAFASEREEAEFWGTHCVGERLLEQFKPLDGVLPRPRRRTR